MKILIPILLIPFIHLSSFGEAIPLSSIELSGEWEEEMFYRITKVEGYELSTGFLRLKTTTSADKVEFNDWLSIDGAVKRVRSVYDGPITQAPSHLAVETGGKKAGVEAGTTFADIADGWASVRFKGDSGEFGYSTDTLTESALFRLVTQIPSRDTATYSITHFNPLGIISARSCLKDFPFLLSSEELASMLNEGGETKPYRKIIFSQKLDVHSSNAVYLFWISEGERLAKAMQVTRLAAGHTTYTVYERAQPGEEGNAF